MSNSTEADITKALYNYYDKLDGSDDWACFHQLRLGTGHICERTIDFFAMNVLPSKKFHTIAFEIKVSVSDYRSELANPRKRLMAETICDSFVFVTPKGLLEQQELISGLGYWEIDERGEVIVNRHPYKNSEAKLVVPSWPFLAAVLRREARIERGFRKEPRE